MEYLTELADRKAALQRIVPLVPVTGGRWGKKLNWTEYFQDHPDDAVALGYDQRETRPELWNRNNVLGRFYTNKSGKTSNGNSPPPLKPYAVTGGLLKDIDARRDLLLAIMQKMPKTRNGTLQWLSYFKDNPWDASALGYDIRQTKPKIWAANLRMTQQKSMRAALRTGHLPPTVRMEVQEIEPDAAAKRIAHEMSELESEIKELRGKLKVCEIRIADMTLELDAAKAITFDLLLQLREANG